MTVKYTTCVLSDSDVAALRAIRSVVADSNHPDRAALIALVSRLDGSAKSAHMAPQAYRASWVANPGHEIPVEADEQIALRLVRIGAAGEAPITHRILDTPIPAGIRHEVLGYAVTAIVSSGDGPAEQKAAWMVHERTVFEGGRSP